MQSNTMEVALGDRLIDLARLIANATGKPVGGGWTVYPDDYRGRAKGCTVEVDLDVDRLRTTAPHLGGAVRQHDWTADTLAGALREADVSLGLGIDCEVYGRRFRFDTVVGCWVEVCEECDGRGESVEGAPCECRAPTGGAL